jgi:VIT1/CCC1 family predicted Fe2+/Mn2+ transporter
MVELYMNKGLDEPHARAIVTILASNRKVFVDVMMAEELGISQDAETKIPWKHGAINFTSFMGFGIVPLIAYLVIIGIESLHSYVFYVSIIITLLTLFGMGLMQVT